MLDFSEQTNSRLRFISLRASIKNQVNTHRFHGAIQNQGRRKMSEFEEEVKKAEKELNQSLVPLVPERQEDEFLGDLKMQAEDYGQRIQDVAGKAKVFAEEKAAWAGEKFKELQNKDPKELIEDAKEFARQKPGQTILISAAIGMVIGFLLKRR